MQVWKGKEKNMKISFFFVIIYFNNKSQNTKIGLCSTIGFLKLPLSLIFIENKMLYYIVKKFRKKCAISYTKLYSANVIRK